MGVLKSALGEADFLAVGEMSRMGGGMHTTTSATLIRLKGGGLLADTPGAGPTCGSMLCTE